MDGKIIDVKYNKLDSNGNIKPPAFLSIGEVARELGEKISRIRYWDDIYSEFLDTDRSGSHRRFSKQDVAKLKLIQGLWHQKYSHEHIKNEIREFNFDEENMVVSIDQSNTSNELQVQLLASALMEVMKNELDKAKADIIEEVSNKVQLSNERLREEVCVTVSDSVLELKDEMKNYLITEIESGFMKELEATREMNEKLDSMREIMESRSDRNKKKGLLGKIFG